MGKKIIVIAFLFLLLFLLIGCCYASDTGSTSKPINNEIDNSNGPFVGSINSNVYHYSWCSSAKQIHPENLIVFSSSSDAKSHGYRPCKKCNPPG